MGRFFLALVGALTLATAARAEERWERLAPPAPLSPPAASGYVETPGARIWYAAYGAGPPVILLHGGLANSESWGDLAPVLAQAHRVILIDSRGHGRSSWDGTPLSYGLMATDVLAVMNHLHLHRPDVVGWSDGGIIGLDLAINHPDRIRKLVAFGANSDLSGLRTGGSASPIFRQVGPMIAASYARLSPTPDGFARFAAAVGAMQATQPNYTPDQLGRIKARVLIMDGDHEEGIKREHTEYMAHTIPGAQLALLPGTSHFAPLQDPEAFAAAILGFLDAR